MTIHTQNIQALAIKVHKVINNIAPTIVSELISFSSVNYKLRKGSQFYEINHLRRQYGMDKKPFHT